MLRPLITCIFLLFALTFKGYSQSWNVSFQGGPSYTFLHSTDQDNYNPDQFELKSDPGLGFGARVNFFTGKNSGLSAGVNIQSKNYRIEQQGIPLPVESNEVLIKMGATAYEIPVVYRRFFQLSDRNRLELLGGLNLSFFSLTNASIRNARANEPILIADSSGNFELYQDVRFDFSTQVSPGMFVGVGHEWVRSGKTSYAFNVVYQYDFRSAHQTNYHLVTFQDQAEKERIRGTFKPRLSYLALRLVVTPPIRHYRDEMARK